MPNSYKLFIASLCKELDKGTITGTELATKAGISKTYLSQIKNGHKNASLEVREAIAKALGKSEMEMTREGELLSAARPETPASAQEINVDMTLALVAEKYRDLETELYRLRTLIETMGDAVCMVDKDSRLLFQNQKHRELFGVATGDTCENVHKCEDFSKSRCNSRLALETGLVKQNIFKRGNRSYSVVTTPMRDMAGAIYGASSVIHDVTAIEDLLEIIKANNLDERPKK